MWTVKNDAYVDIYKRYPHFADGGSDITNSSADIHMYTVRIYSEYNIIDLYFLVYKKNGLQRPIF
jgi:hypothetical protein